MKTDVIKNRDILVRNKQRDYFLYVFLSIGLILLGLISLETIPLNRTVITILGIIAIGLISALVITDLTKLLLIFVLYIPFSRFLPGNFGTGLWAFNLTNIFLIAILISICIEKLKSGNIVLFPSSSINLLILIFCFLGIISFIKSAYYFGYEYFNQFFSPLKEWLTPMILFFLFLVSVKNKEDIKKLITLVIFITICISILVVFEYLSIRGAEDFDKMRAGAIFEQPNRAGAFFVYYSFILVGLLLVNIGSFKYWLLLIPILVSARALMYTYSRGAIIAFVCAGLFITFVKNKLIFLILLFLIIFAILNPTILPSSLYKRFSSTFTGESEIYQSDIKTSLEPSARNRLIVWEGAISMIKDHPLLGVGYGVFPYSILLYAPVSELDAHNTYLIIAAELGLIALVIFLWIITAIFKNAWFVYRKSKDKFIKAFALGFLGGIIGIVICNIFGSRLDSLELTGLFWVLTALIFKSKELIKKGEFI